MSRIPTHTLHVVQGKCVFNFALPLKITQVDRYEHVSLNTPRVRFVDIIPNVINLYVTRYCDAA